MLFIDAPPIDPLRLITTMQELKTCRYDGKSKLIWQVKSADSASKISNIEHVLLRLGS